MHPRHNAYYSIIQFCPDASRCEVANVGIVLFCPDLNYLEAITTESNDRIKRFFEIEIDDERLQIEKFGIQRRLQTCREEYMTLESLQRFIDTRCNRMVMTPLRSIAVFEDETPEMVLMKLYNKLVENRQE